MQPGIDPFLVFPIPYMGLFIAFRHSSFTYPYMGAILVSILWLLSEYYFLTHRRIADARNCLRGKDGEISYLFCFCPLLFVLCGLEKFIFGVKFRIRGKRFRKLFWWSIVIQKCSKIRLWTFFTIFSNINLFQNVSGFFQSELNVLRFVIFKTD